MAFDLASLEAAAAALPGLLGAADTHVRASLGPGPLLATGAGLAGGPARLVAAAAAALGQTARYVAPSELLEPLAPAGVLALFSQNLSPNARLAARVPGRKVAFTGVDPDGDGPASAWLRAFLGPDGVAVPVFAPEAHGGLVRLQSPTLAAFAGLRALAGGHPDAPWALQLPDVPEAAARALDRRFDAADVEAAIASPPVLVTGGADPRTAHGLAAKWAEARFDGPPPIVDALELAHGSLHAMASSPRLLVGLETTALSWLFSLVRATAEESGHRYVGLSAQLPGPLAWFEHDAGFNRLLLSALAQKAVEPPSVSDDHLYPLGADEPPVRALHPRRAR